MNTSNSPTSDRLYPCPRCGANRPELELACPTCLWTPKPPTFRSAEQHFVYVDRHVPKEELADAIRCICDYAFPLCFLICLGSIAQIARGNPFEVVQGVIFFSISGATFLSLLRLGLQSRS